MTPAYTKQFDLQTQETNIGAEKIAGLSLETFKMVIGNF